MIPEAQIQPLNVTAATMIVQILLMCLLAGTSKLIVGEYTTPGQTFLRGSMSSRLLQRSPLFVVTIISFLLLMLSGEFYAMWSPILGGAGLATISAATATSCVFFIDILAIAYLVAATGGSASSPFLTALFTIPALAIFLRATPFVFFSLAIVAVVLYLLLFAVEEPAHSQHGDQGKRAAAFLNVTCLLLSMVTGYITRPASIDQIQHSKAVTSAPAEVPASAAKPY